MFRSFFLAGASLILGASYAHATCAANYLVIDTTATTSLGTTYNFTLYAGCDTQNAFQTLLIPYFSDANISNIVLPSNWTYTISTSNVFNLPGAETLELMPTTPLSGLTYETQISGISFTSNYGPVDGPIGDTQSAFGTYFIDPPIPGSPNTIQALADVAVPEPSSALLGITGLLIAAGGVRRMHRRSA